MRTTLKTFWHYPIRLKLGITLWSSNSTPGHMCGPLGSSVHGIFQARILEWIAISSFRGSSWPRGQTCISCVSCIAGRFFTHWAMREAGRIPCRNTGTDALSIFIIACSEQPRAPMSIKNKTDILWYIYTMKYYNDKNKQITAKQKCMIKSSRYNIEQTCQIQQNIEHTIPCIHNSNKDKTKHFREAYLDDIIIKLRTRTI